MIRFGGCLSLGILKSLSLAYSTFDHCSSSFLIAARPPRPRCTAFSPSRWADFALPAFLCSGLWAGSIAIWWLDSHVPVSFPVPDLYRLEHLSITNSNVQGSLASTGGAIQVEEIPFSVSIEHCDIENSTATGQGGAIVSTQDHQRSRLLYSPTDHPHRSR